MNEKRAELEALAERVEREEPSRDMDAAIARAIGWRQHPMVEGFAVAPSWTTSLDAAVTLVPSGYATTISLNPDGTAIASMWREEPFIPAPTILHSKPRLPAAAALTAAALRALAQEAADGH